MEDNQLHELTLFPSTLRLAFKERGFLVVEFERRPIAKTFQKKFEELASKPKPPGIVLDDAPGRKVVRGNPDIKDPELKAVFSNLVLDVVKALEVPLTSSAAVGGASLLVNCRTLARPQFIHTDFKREGWEKAQEALWEWAPLVSASNPEGKEVRYVRSHALGRLKGARGLVQKRHAKMKAVVVFDGVAEKVWISHLEYLVSGERGGGG